MKKFENHPSILSIKKNVTVDENFSFTTVCENAVFKEICSLDGNKSGTFGNIPTKLLKETSDICTKSLTDVWNNEVINNNCFSEKLKVADITPIFKKDDATMAKNYRPISVLPSVSKVFERIILSQLIPYIENYLSTYLCGYRKGFSTQYALISLIEKWKAILDKKGYAGAVLMDLSKTFDTINHELLIAKLYAYGIGKDSLKILWSYLKNRFQRTKINSTFSSWSELTKGVPQGSVLGPILFNIYLNDLFFILENTEVCNFADDTTPFACSTELKDVLISLEHDTVLAISWFDSNYMKLNTDKCDLLVSGTRNEHIWAKVGNDKIWESESVKLLGVHIDSQLKFEEHVLKICLKASRKLTALSRMSKFLCFNKRRTLFKAFFQSQFQYCPLIWMFCSRKMNNKINRLQERALRFVFNDYNSSFQNLLIRDGSVTVHHNNIRLLAIEMYKVKNELSPNHIIELFTRSNRSTNRAMTDFLLPETRTDVFGKNSLRYFGPKIWNIVPQNIKNASSLPLFKTMIKQWTPLECPCRLCMHYEPRLGYINIID